LAAALTRRHGASKTRVNALVSVEQTPPVTLSEAVSPNPSVPRQLSGNLVSRLSEKITVVLEGRHKLRCRRWRIRDSVEKCVAILAREDHTFMLVEHPPRAFVGEVSRCQASNRHGVPDELLRRTGDAQLDALALELTIDR
jgi:hypothetical protein